MLIKVLDIFSALLVIMCLFLKFQYNFLWLIYGLGCLIFIFINFYKKLPGQAIMNLIATVVAIKNYFN